MAEVVTKLCPKCDTVKSLDEFSRCQGYPDGRHYLCKSCMAAYQRSHNNTLKGHLRVLVRSAKANAKARLEKGRIDAGVFDLDITHMFELWDKQGGLCYYSKIPMNFDRHEWSPSLERLDPEKGYTVSNVALCCAEFNQRCQWTHTKIAEMRKILAMNITENYQDFEKNTVVKPKSSFRTAEMQLIDDVKHHRCTKCGEMRKEDLFLKRKKYGCLECRRGNNNAMKMRPRYAIQLLLGSSLTATKTRESRSTAHLRDLSHDITFDYLVQVFNDQKGLCAYTGLPMKFGNYLEKNWCMSLERIDVFKGYTKGNVCLVCLEFNGADKSVCYTKEDGTGNAGWTKDKFNVFLKHLNLNNTGSSTAAVP